MEKIRKIKKFFNFYKIDGYLIPKNNEFLNENIENEDNLKYITNYSGSYGLVSTARDFLHFQQMLANGGELLGNRIVNLDSVTRMSSNQVGSLYYGKAKRGDDTNSEGFGYTVSITLDSENSSISIEDDGPGFPKDILTKIGEPYIKSLQSKNKSKAGLGLGIFIGKTLLEKNKAKLLIRNSETRGGAEIKIEWLNKDLISI